MFTIALAGHNSNINTGLGNEKVEVAKQQILGTWINILHFSIAHLIDPRGKCRVSVLLHLLLPLLPYGKCVK